MAVGDVYEVNLEYGVHQRPMTVNLWYQVGQDPATPGRTAQDLLDALAGQTVVEFLSNLQAAKTRWDQARAYLRVAAAGGESQGAPGFLHQERAGQISGEALPDSLPMVIEWGQSAISAKANGRCFLSGIAESSITGNRLSDAFIASEVATFISNWQGTLTYISGADGGTYRQVVMSKHLDLVPYLSDKYGSPLDVTGVVVNPLIKNQKRRQSRWESAPRT